MDKKSCSSLSCDKDAPLKCSGCRVARYCSQEHQRAHWKEHQQTCNAFKEEWDTQVGKHLVSCKNLKPGTEFTKLHKLNKPSICYFPLFCR